MGVISYTWHGSDTHLIDGKKTACGLKFDPAKVSITEQRSVVNCQKCWNYYEEMLPWWDDASYVDYQGKS